MSAQWKSFIESRATTLISDRMPDCALFDLSSLGLIRLEGDDAIGFMQGQFTNDSRNLAEDHSQLSALCTPKGRMLALFRIIGHGDGWLLQLPQTVLPGALKRLQMFILRSKVSLSDASESLVSIGLAGPACLPLVEKLVGKTPEIADALVQSEGISCVRLSGDTPRFMLIVPTEKAEGLWQGLEQDASPASIDLWRLLTIRSGEPVVHSETVEAFIPQMANLQLINGLSFTKGCYTGQ
jgi:hypothetical protein